MRAPAVSGQFYPRDKKDLNKVMSKCFEGLTSGKRPVFGAVVPHAGYIYSGSTAASVYSVLPEADTFVLLGPNHTGYGSAVAVSSEKWNTPLGDIEADLDFIKAIPKYIIDTDEISHKYEHSIEVQLPFLQYRFKDFKIAPICMGMQDEETAFDVGTAVARTVLKFNKKVVIIASSDFSHYKPDKVAHNDDAYFIQSIIDLDVPGFYRKLYERSASVCGYGPIAAMLTASKELGAKKGTLVKYSTSGDTTGDFAAVVGYAGIIVE